jgi:hypothetical protein
VNALNWLPLDAMMGETPKAAAAAGISAWSSRWFASTRVGVSQVTRMSTPNPFGFRERESLDPFHIIYADQGIARMLAHALDCDFAELVRGDLDRKLMRDLKHKIVSDLGETLSAIFTTTTRKGAAEDGWIGFELIAGDGHPILTITAPSSLLADFVHNALPAASGEMQLLSPLTSALSPTTVALSVSIGRAPLTLTEMAGLAPGDVLVLDRHLQDGAFVVPASGQSVLAGDLCEEEGHVAVCIRRFGAQCETTN